MSLVTLVATGRFLQGLHLGQSRHQMQCLQVMATLATDQFNSAGDALLDGLSISSFVLQLLGLLLAADQSISLGNSSTAFHLSARNFSHFSLLFVFSFVLELPLKPLSQMYLIPYLCGLTLSVFYFFM